MDELFHKINGRLQGIESSQKMSVREIASMRASIKRLDTSTRRLETTFTQQAAATGELRGAFAGIEKLLKDHEQRITTIEKKLGAA